MARVIEERNGAGLDQVDRLSNNGPKEEEQSLKPEWQKLRWGIMVSFSYKTFTFMVLEALYGLKFTSSSDFHVKILE
jgi:hypothetical protein